MKKTLIVIPALNPNPSFISYVEELIQAGFKNILVINDGSDSKYDSIYNQINDKEECTVYKHAVNLGKGRALKNSINYFLNLPDYREYTGIITVDSDGQHTVGDVVQLDKAMLLDSNKIYFGSRDFNEEDIPFKSRLGNKLTTFLFWMLYGKKIRDTQTGLRGIPTSFVSSFIDLKGERFQYEMNVLIEAVYQNIEIEEISIKTLYFDDNSETHFHPIKDSLQIMGQLFGTFLKYVFSSISSFVIDILLFHIFVLIFGNMAAGVRILVATILSRVGSSACNFYMNKNVVFENSSRDSALIVRYFSLVLIQMLLSWFFVMTLFKILPLSETFIKIIVDSILFLFSYRIQKMYVFKKR
ncbi:MAG TPA: bifunctional glycosyltransferase family 2/GtrA family protein [Candidatus Jeotgalibaca pullicola]|nr:bifunctional glycosyltransferase family 2/GtrA family protein [Candidatus Jeotgalibaca pullicola]